MSRPAVPNVQPTPHRRPIWLLTEPIRKWTRHEFNPFFSKHFNFLILQSCVLHKRVIRILKRLRWSIAQKRLGNTNLDCVKYCTWAKWPVVALSIRLLRIKSFLAFREHLALSKKHSTKFDPKSFFFVKATCSKLVKTELPEQTVKRRCMYRVFD